MSDGNTDFGIFASFGFENNKSSDAWDEIIDNGGLTVK